MSALVAKVGRRVGRLDLDVAIDTTGGPVVVVGPNGAGKTTTLLLLLGGLKPTTGKIILGGRTLFDATADLDVPVELRRIGYVPQGYGLMPHLTVAGHVAFAVKSRGLRGAALREKVDAHLDDLGIGHLAARRIGGLSGGERQRLALARALAAEPAALLLDEPLAALDVGARAEVRRHLVELVARVAVPTVLVSHDPDDARALGGRVVVVEGGRVVQAGTVDDVASAPGSAFAAAFFR